MDKYTEILIKAFKNYNLTHLNSFTRFGIINTNDIKKFVGCIKMGNHIYAYNIQELLIVDTHLNIVIQEYLQLKIRYWFDNYKNELFLILRRIFGRDLGKFMIEIISFEIFKQIIVDLEQFKNLCLRYQQQEDEKIINKVFNLCEFPTITADIPELPDF